MLSVVIFKPHQSVVCVNSESPSVQVAVLSGPHKQERAKARANCGKVRGPSLLIGQTNSRRIRHVDSAPAFDTVDQCRPFRMRAVARPGLKSAMARPDAADPLARRFCLALAQETAGMQPGTWRMVDTIAHRMGVTFEEASAIADDCARRQWADHEFPSIRLREAGRRIAVGARKAVVSRQQPAEAQLRTTERPRKSGQPGRQQMTDLEKLQHEIYLLGEIINSNAAALKSKAMSDEDREALQRQITMRTAHRKVLQQRLDRLSK
jgi:hypothetical protein